MGLDESDNLLAVQDQLGAMFSRSASSPLVGKRTALVKTLLTDEVADAFRRRALDLGYSSLSDALRDLVELSLYGPEHLASLRQKQLAALARNGTGIGPDEDPTP